MPRSAGGRYWESDWFADRLGLLLTVGPAGVLGGVAAVTEEGQTWWPWLVAGGLWVLMCGLLWWRSRH